ncbi:hypothetical protein KIW84_013850 [Lathyrus oleraceus]|uniref:Uncharacterized protein n=1 Tax=Pisum sativum TaxID=3888 RepID=A0A9D5GYB7_PEA|nr:hypothetical protein KIW84_013850 [Pisum sativum]
MPYACERPMSMVVVEPLTLPNQDVEELEDALTKMKQERDMFLFRQMSYWYFFRASAKLTHRYNTRANHSKIMEHLEQENKDLKDKISCLTAMMESVLAAQSQSSPTPSTPPPQRTSIFEVATSTIPATSAHFAPNMLAGFPCGMPPNFVPEAHREALQKVLEQVYVEHDVKVDLFDHIVANITSYNNLSFCDEELPKEGRNHNLALHISMNCKDDALLNVLVDTGSSLNVLPKSTLSRFSYQGAPMRYSGVIVKAFDDSRKTVIGIVDLPIKIGLSDFQISFQVMDIHPAYSCLLGRSWIHEEGPVTLTLHQKLKFVKNGKLVIVGGEKELLVSHLSSFSYVEAEDEVETPFQALSIAEEKRVGAPMSSFKDALRIVEDDLKMLNPVFHSGGFIHGNEQHLAVVLEGDEDEDCTNFVTHGKTCNNWTAVDIPAEEESDEDVSDELYRLLEHEGKAIQPFEEQIKLVNLDSEDDVKEVKIGSRLYPEVKKGLINLLREYSDVFAWSYQDMPGLDSKILEH